MKMVGKVVLLLCHVVAADLLTHYAFGSAALHPIQIGVIVLLMATYEPLRKRWTFSEEVR